MQLYLVHLPCSSHVSMVLQSFVHEVCWTGSNGSRVLDTNAGCQRCWEVAQLPLEAKLTTPMALLQGLRHTE